MACAEVTASAWHGVDLGILSLLEKDLRHQSVHGVPTPFPQMPAGRRAALPMRSRCLEVALTLDPFFRTLGSGRVGALPETQ